MIYHIHHYSLLLPLVLVELQNTFKKKLNRKTLEQPNICYIFEKLRVQGCQMGHSHVSIPFNSAPAHSTRPHNAKKALYIIISPEIPENFNTLQTRSKIIFFSLKKLTKNNRDFIKGGRGRVSILWSDFTKNLLFYEGGGQINWNHVCLPDKLIYNLAITSKMTRA